MEKILEAQTAELNRRADNLAAGISQRDRRRRSIRCNNNIVNRTLAQAGSKTCSAFGTRARVASGTGRARSASGRRSAAAPRTVCARRRRTISAKFPRSWPQRSLDARNDFEFARKEAASKWNEELDASGVRAAHSAAESIGRSSEWFQQEARARLQVLVEQTITSAAAAFDEKTGEATKTFGAATGGRIRKSPRSNSRAG